MISRHRSKRLLIPLMIVAFSAMTTGTEAGFIGHSIHSQYFAPDLDSLYNDQGTKLVNPTATFTAIQNGSPFLQATIGDANLTITSVFGSSQSFFNATFNGFSFTDTNNNLGVTSFSIAPTTNISGFNASDVTLSQGRLLVNLSGLQFPTTGVISLSFSPASVPEPASLAMLGMGVAVVAAFGLLRRHGRRLA